MKKNIAIYLAGSIKKGHEKDETFWAEENISDIQQALNKYSISFLNPAFRKDDLSNNLSVFGRDMLQVFSSHVVLVDARDKRGLGVGAEMMWAKINNLPVVTWAPKNSHYFKDKTDILGVPVDNFIHPFVYALSDKIVENLEQACTWIDFIISSPHGVPIKGIDYITSAMQIYKDNQLDQDIPMKKLIQAGNELTNRMTRALPTVVFK